jgi:hypothetical protein
MQGKGRRLSPFPCTYAWRSPAYPTFDNLAFWYSDFRSPFLIFSFRLFFCSLCRSAFLWKNFSLGTSRSDDSQLSRPVASPAFSLLELFLKHRGRLAPFRIEDVLEGELFCWFHGVPAGLEFRQLFP